MIFLATWCPNCSWWLLPLLLGAWFLGWLVWGAVKGGSYKNIIKGLQGDLTDLRSQKNEVETDLAKANYEFEKVNSEKLGLFNETKAWEEKYNQLHKTASTNTVTKVDTSGYQAKIAEQAAQLETYRKNNLLLETEFQGLKRRYASLETQIDVEDDASTASDNATNQTVDTTEYQTKIAEQVAQLETYRNNNLQLESEFQSLKEKYADLESQLDASNISNAGTVSDSNVDADATDYVAQIDDLKRQLEASHLANTQLKSDFSAMQLNYADMGTIQKETPTETNNNRLSDLELQLSIVRNANAELEANYANLKSNFGEMELSLQAARNEKVDVTAYNTRIEELKSQIEASEKSKLKLEKDYKKLKKKYDDTTIIPLVKDAPKKKTKKTTTTKAKTIKEDDLTKIEGIGPKIQGLLKDSGIRTWKQLSKTPTPKLRQILTDAGSRYKMHNPGTWAEQALFAAEGKWEELKKWQDELDGGK